MTQLERHRVAVVGAAGHIGLGTALALTQAGYYVDGLDIDEHRMTEIMQGIMPFHEEGGQAALTKAHANRMLDMSSDLSVVTRCKYIVVLIGTPVDGNLNPQMSALTQLIGFLCEYLRSGHVLILRSTMCPGTTDLIRKRIDDQTRFTVGADVHLVCAPERVVQGKVLEESGSLPQMVGAYTSASFLEAQDFFASFSTGKSIFLTPKEAEFGKLLTNMTRYVQFALANEFFLMAGMHGDINVNRVIDAATEDYPRLDLPTPGPNVGGPCLYKDGFLLTEPLPFHGLVSTAFRINEGMPMQIIQRLKRHPDGERVCVLGATFKADSDDMRNSLSVKLVNQLKLAGYDVRVVDTHTAGYCRLENAGISDAVVLMTPHKEFKDWQHIRRSVGKSGTVYVDMWGFWDELRYETQDGLYVDRR